MLAFGQYSIKKFNWVDAGYKGVKPVFNQTINIMSYGGNNTNSAANNLALTNAITALNNKGGVIYFPKGVYNFTTTININRDSIIFKGAGHDSTQLRFTMGPVLSNCINIFGSQNTIDSTYFTINGVRDSNWVNVYNPTLFNVNDWVYVQFADNAFVPASTWAIGSIGQIMQIKSINANKITFYSPFRFNYLKSLQAKITKITPRKVISFECLDIKRMESTPGQTSLISYDKAVQCWLNGIKGDSTNFAHVELNRCSNIEITNSYFHHAYAYGGGGQGYGTVLQFSSGECKIENNVFNNLRHSVLLQAGANGNVIGYNYSFNPYWNESFFPNNSAGDLVLHGNYPFANLFEGNINQNTVIDNSHDKNGPYNTFFRNRSELYGIFMNSSPATDTTQFIGNEVTNNSTGLYTIVGNGNVTYGNNIKGVLSPTNAINFADTSLYLFGANRPTCFTSGNYNWPIFSLPNTYNTNTNAAKDRAMLGKYAQCVCSINPATNFNQSNFTFNNFKIWPNPASNNIKLESKQKIKEVNIYNLNGQLVLNKQSFNITEVNIGNLANGIYIVAIKTTTGIYNSKLIVE